MHSSWSETNYFANQHVRKATILSCYAALLKLGAHKKFFSEKLCLVQRGKKGGSHTKAIPAMTPKPFVETQECQQASLWQRLPLNYLCLLDSQRCNWADVSIWHELHPHHEALSVGMCLTAFCSTRMPTEQAQYVQCGNWLWKTHHKICFQKLDGSLMWSW